MPGLLLKKWPISRYLKDYKHSQTYCIQCGKFLSRTVLVFRGKIINKESISRMGQPIDANVWLTMQHELAALCRFCSEIYCNSHPSYFDIMAFKQYLFEQTDISHSTVREYVVRLRRLDEMLVAHNYPLDKFTSSINHQCIADELPSAAHTNYRIALRKYDQYLAWQKSY